MSDSSAGGRLFAGDADLSEPPPLDDLHQLVRFVQNHTGVLLRYSKGPQADADSGPSRDYEAGVELPGLSATTVEPEPWWPRPAEEWIARRVCKYAELGEQEGRYPWLLTGEIAGYGPDHEPLVVQVRPLARITTRALNQAKALYQQRFTVGRDST
ncbi:hypothetical protein EV646_113129 [Kribbella antiqua]|uniref:Uncharacterized protein n=1 Tax=Kribbella antiqua TaxID=2512217 RepID=A0A4R2IDV8_9ACTN|nr:DUF6098 family protein [Kribbella antiqua]TCO42507.1 hypothetical protein EV646_113129 [Kribbella antiqua]